MRAKTRLAQAAASCNGSSLRLNRVICASREQRRRRDKSLAKQLFREPGGIEPPTRSLRVSQWRVSLFTLARIARKFPLVATRSSADYLSSPISAGKSAVSPTAGCGLATRLQAEVCRYVGKWLSGQLDLGTLQPPAQNGTKLWEEMTD